MTVVVFYLHTLQAFFVEVKFRCGKTRRMTVVVFYLHTLQVFFVEVKFRCGKDATHDGRGILPPHIAGILCGGEIISTRVEGI